MEQGQFAISILYVFVSLLLYWYARELKKSCLWGNLLVAFLCALVAGLVMVAEGNVILLLEKQHSSAFTYVLEVFVGYMVFAFLSTLFREIIKDLEDVEGDQSVGARTLPIVAGQQTAKWVAGFSALLLIFTLGYWWSIINNNNILATAWLVIGIIIPICFALWYLYLAKTKQEFHQLSQLAKFIMLSGLLYLIVL